MAAEADLVLVVGSQNSSNSQRLAELARAGGVSAHLVDGPEDIDLAWFRDVETVLITAGASAPELVVEECLTLLQEKLGASVEPRTICEENVKFVLPKPLR